MNRHDVVIIGGGISGATLLHKLASAGVDVVLLESRGRLGGVIWSHRNAEGLLAETGANSTAINAELQALIEELDLASAVLTPSPDAANRFIVRDGRLIPAPSEPRSFLRTPLFSRSAKLRAMREPFIRPVSADIEESVAGFVERRLGREFLDFAIDPLVGGIFAGRPERLSLRHAFPLMHRLEQENGSIIRGAFRKARATRRERRRGVPPMPKGLISFDEGMGVLPARIEERWKDRVLCDHAVERIRHQGEVWAIDTVAGSYEARRLVLATEAPIAASLLESVDLELARALQGIEYPPVTVVVSHYDRRAVTHPLNGFGMLIPSVEGRKILGALFSSTLFPNRAPDGTVLLTTFVGGARSPKMARASDDELRHVVHAELQRLLGISAQPIAFDLHRWERAIPQYTLGYGQVLDAITESETRFGNLHILGSYRGGISVGDCVRSATALSGQLLSHLREPTGDGVPAGSIDESEHRMHDQEV